jgi:hypothetical protein
MRFRWGEEEIDWFRFWQEKSATSFWALATTVDEIVVACLPVTYMDAWETRLHTCSLVYAVDSDAGLRPTSRRCGFANIPASLGPSLLSSFITHLIDDCQKSTKMEMLASRNSMSGPDDPQVLGLQWPYSWSCSSNVCMSLHLFCKWNTKQYELRQSLALTLK